MEYNLDGFLESINSINESYDKCIVIVTARDYYAEKYKMYPAINLFRLLGFNDDLIMRYLDSRFTKNKGLICKVLDMVSSLQLKDDGRLFPLYLDIICKIYEIDPCDASPCDKKISKYFISNLPIDCLLIELLEREISKQSLAATVDDMFEFLSEISVLSKNSSNLTNAKEFIALIEPNFSNEIFPEQVYSKYFVNSLLFVDEERMMINLRYDFVDNIIKSRYLFFKILKKEIDIGVVNVLEEMYDGSS